jgi:hypothetical protein
MPTKEKQIKPFSSRKRNHVKNPTGFLVDNTDEIFSGGIIIDFVNKQIR